MVLWSLLISILVLGAQTSAVSTTNRSLVDGTNCQRRFVNENSRSETEQYKCPDFGDSPDQTLCCDKTSERCCLAPKATKFYELPQQTAIIIATVVVLAAVILTGAMIVCCCWEKCPLYMACRAEAKPDYIAKPDDVAGFSLMPDDNVEDAKVYEPGKASSAYNMR